MQFPSLVPPNKHPVRNFLGLGTALIEFQLWDSVLRFTCPKPSYNCDPEYRREFFIDQRPFVNTKSRAKYVEFNSEYSFIDIYRTGWDITQGLFGLNKVGTLILSLQVFYLSDDGIKRFGEMTIPRHMEEWVNEAQRIHQARMAQLNITNAHADFFKITPQVQKENLLDSHENISLTSIGNVGGLLVLVAQPYFNVFDYYACINAREFLKFSFAISYIDSISNKQSCYLENKCSAIVSTVMSSVNYMAGIKDMGTI